jgi:hypothetical protein
MTRSSLLSIASLGTSSKIRRALLHESRVLALERLGYASAPAVRHGLGRGIGEDIFFPFLQPIEDARRRRLGEAFSISKPRIISVSIGPRKTTWTVTPWPAKSALSDCVMFDDWPRGGKGERLTSRHFITAGTGVTRCYLSRLAQTAATWSIGPRTIRTYPAARHTTPDPPSLSGVTRNRMNAPTPVQT